MSNGLANQNILLIGGTSGIGFAVAKQALAAGANITVTSSTQERVNKTLESLSAIHPGHSSKLRGYVADLSVRDQLEVTIEKLPKFAAEPFPIDHIVFTAGNVPPLVPLAQASFDNIEALVNYQQFHHTLHSSRNIIQRFLAISPSPY